MKKIITNVALALTLCVFYTSCDKTKDDALDTDTSSSTDNSTSENAFSDMFKSVTEVADATPGVKSATCYTVTIDTTVGVGAPWPKTITIDYGACSDKKGKIKAVFTGLWSTAGSTITITADSNYMFGLNKVKCGVHTILNNGVNVGGPLAGHKSFFMSVAGASPGAASAISWTTQRTITQIAGESTPTDTSDDVFQIEGSTSGVSAKGVTYTSVITTPLVVAVSCPWIEKGVITLTPKGKKARSIDFGPGTCDNEANVTVGTTVYPVKM